MTQPLTPPTFTASYNVPPTDIGSGYAKGISSAGQSIAGAISAIMGGVNPQTGEAEPGLLQQGQNAHDTLDIMHSMGMFDDPTYEKLKTSSLGAQQKMIGLYTTQATAKYQSQLEAARAMQLEQAQAQAAMARTQVEQAGAMARQKVIQETKETVAGEKQPALVRNPQQSSAPPPSNLNPQPGGPLAIPPTLNLRTGY